MPKALWIWTPPSTPDTLQHERKAKLSFNKMKPGCIIIGFELPALTRTVDSRLG